MKTLHRLLSIFSFALVALAAQGSVSEPFSQTYPLAADGVVQLENANGDIDITAWDKAEVSLVADKRAKNDDDLKRLEIEVDAQPARLSIKTKYAKKSGWSFFGGGNYSVRYKLMVPAGARLDKIESVNSDITVTGVHGSVKLATVNGRIAATGLMADARLNSVNGSLSAEFVALEQVREVKLKSVNGRAEITLPKGASARLKTGTVNGSCSVEQPIKLDHAGKRNLSGNIGTGTGAAILLETVNGSIAVKER